jgi:ABC-type lipoprotein export system ATPase subunit
VTATATAALAACHDVTVLHGNGAGQIQALRAVNFVVRANERVGLVGASGSGKTTLLHVLGGLVSPVSGEVLLGGDRLSSLDAAARGQARSSSIAYVFQGANLLPTFTAYENVAFAAHIHHGRELGPVELLQLVGLGHKLDALPAELSGGEAQRVAIARALAQRPRLLLCDEPTGQLDSGTGARVLDLIQALQERLGFALVIATHDPEVALRTQRIVTLEDGRVVSDEELERG